MSKNNIKKQESEFLFLLRTNVGYFTPSQDSIILEDKVKQASILFDAVVFEDGLYRAQAGASASFDIWVPGYQVTDEMINDLHVPVGGRFELRMGDEEPRQTVLSSDTEVSYGAQFISLIRENKLHQYDWFKRKQFELKDSGKRIANDMAKKDKDSVKVPFSDTEFVKSLVLKNLNHDLVISAAFRRPISIDSVYEPLLFEKMKSHPETFEFTGGFDSLAIVIPSFTDLSWDQIAEVRQSSTLKEFRNKLQEFEQVVEDISFKSYDEYQNYLHTQFEKELLSEIENLKPSKIRTASKNVIGLVPFVGPIITAGFDRLEIEKFNQSWLALVLTLRN